MPDPTIPALIDAYLADRLPGHQLARAIAEASQGLMGVAFVRKGRAYAVDHLGHLWVWVVRCVDDEPAGEE